MIVLPQRCYVAFFRICDIDKMSADRLAATVGAFYDALSGLGPNAKSFSSPLGGGVLCETVDDALAASSQILDKLGAGVVVGLSSGIVSEVHDVTAINYSGHSLNRAARLAYLESMAGRAIASDEFVQDAIQARESLKSGYFGPRKTGKVKRTELSYHLVETESFVKSSIPALEVSEVGMKPELMHVLLTDIYRYSELSEEDQKAAVEKLAVEITNAHRLLGRGSIADDMEIRYSPAGDGGAVIFTNSQAMAAWSVAKALQNYTKDRGLMVRIGLDSGQMVRRGSAMPLGPAVLNADRTAQLAGVGEICVNERFIKSIPEYERQRIISHVNTRIVSEEAQTQMVPEIPKNVSREVYSRDFIKTCTVRLSADENPTDRIGFFVSDAGHILTSAENVGETGNRLRIYMRGGVRLYRRAGPLSEFCIATVLEKNSQLALLKVDEEVVTPYLTVTMNASVGPSDEVVTGFRWWAFKKDQQKISEAKIVSVDSASRNLLAVPANGSVAMRGSAVLHKKSGCVVGIVLDGSDSSRIAVLGAGQIIAFLSSIVRLRIAQQAFSFPLTIDSKDPFCRLYIERKPDEQLRSYLLGEHAEYIRLISPPRMGVTTLFERFKFENVRFQSYESRLSGPVKNLKNLLWSILDELSKRSGCGLPGKIPTNVKNYFAEFVHKTVPAKLKEQIVVYQIDRIESLILDEQLLKTFFEFFEDLHSNDLPPYDPRVRFAVTGHVKTEAERGKLARNPLLMEVSLRHFLPEQSREMTNHLSMVGLNLSEADHKAIHDWTGGHPYLLHYVCRVLADEQPYDVKELMDQKLKRVLVTNPRPELNNFKSAVTAELIGANGTGTLDASVRFKSLCTNPDQEEPLITSDDALMRLYHLGAVRESENAGYVKIGGRFFVESCKEQLVSV